MEQYLVVDGYNIIGAWPELHKLKAISLEEARDRLIRIMADYQAFSGKKVTIVFDAYHVPGAQAALEQQRLAIVFTKEKETADECIERLVSGLLGRKRHVYVATSDQVEQNVIFGKGAYRLSARELLLDVQEASRDISRTVTDQNTHVRGRNTLDGRLDGDLKERLERWRRQK